MSLPAYEYSSQGSHDGYRASSPYVSPSDTPFFAQPEPDDELHEPDPPGRKARGVDLRGLMNLVVVAILILALLMLFAGYPILSALRKHGPDLQNLNGTGQVPDLPLPSLIDVDTPNDAKEWTSQSTQEKLQLVFSDEFEQDGRTFFPGDDPFWEAVDIYYGATNDYEWYAPEAVNTTGGALQLTLTQKTNHNLNFQSGMVQSWNKLCFQGGYLEMSVKLPGTQKQRGFWPGLWTMGNLGRPGYLGSTDGMWPYSYQACDWGTLPNQTNPDGTGPDQTIHAHGPYSYQSDYKLSFLPGQRASACTCPGEDHPGPHVGVGRSAPEIDLVEAQNANKVGMASQSLQVAPYDANYTWDFDAATFYNGGKRNSYTGAVFQEAVSGTQQIPAEAYVQEDDARFVTFGVEITPDWDYNGKGAITWYLDGKRSWTAPSAAIGPNEYTEISQRIIPVEPMSIVMNLGISQGFQGVYFDELKFPAVMQIDYVRLYQKQGQTKVSCDPPDHPTKDYISRHLDLYLNPNHSVFPQDQYNWPKNRLLETC